MRKSGGVSLRRITSEALLFAEDRRISFRRGVNILNL
jgi:hypothetical protein